MGFSNTVTFNKHKRRHFRATNFNFISFPFVDAKASFGIVNWVLLKGEATAVERLVRTGIKQQGD